MRRDLFLLVLVAGCAGATPKPGSLPARDPDDTVEIAIATGAGGKRIAGNPADVPADPAVQVCVTADGAVSWHRESLDGAPAGGSLPGWRYEPFIVAGGPVPFCESRDPAWIVVPLSSGSGGQFSAGDREVRLPDDIKRKMARRKMTQLTIIVRLDVAEDGSVSNVTWVDPVDPPTDVSYYFGARIREWRYTPFRLQRLGDRPLPFRTVVAFMYHLHL